LEEIENAINTIASIKESAVVYKRLNDSYGKIIAYIVCETNINDSVIKEELKNQIPHYMIPSKIEFMQILPKNSNGKIDRKQLKTI
jgi:D-alanine--poly(phosphoribitol) ligase subunit 1